MDKSNTTNNSTKIKLALAALMFFSPLINLLIQKNNIKLEQEQKSFVKWYIKLWYIWLIIAAITIISYITYMSNTTILMQNIYNICIITLTFTLFLWTILILTESDINWFWPHLIWLNIQKTDLNKKDIILRYLPIYNIYLRYHDHDFENPNNINKESIIIRLVFMILCFTTNTTIVSLYLILIIFRITSLVWWIDILTPSIQSFINKLFKKNPEELRWYVRWSVLYLYKKLNNTNQDIQINNLINQNKEKLWLLYNTQTENYIWIQYWLWFIISLYIYQKFNFDITQREIFLPTVMILWRYLIMIIKWQHLPALPIYQEIYEIIIIIYKKIQNRYKNHFTNK